MGTHPIFESDFDCLTERTWTFQGNLCCRPKEQGLLQAIPAKVQETSRGKDRLLRPKASLCPGQEQVQHPKVPTCRPNYQQGHRRPDRLRSTPGRCHRYLRLRPRASSIRHQRWSHQLLRCLRHRSFDRLTSPTRRLTPPRRLHSDATWIPVLPEPQLVPESSVSSRAVPMLVSTSPTPPSDSPDSPTASSTLRPTRTTSLAATSVTTWRSSRKKTRRLSSDSSPDSSRTASTPRTSRRCTRRPTPPSEPILPPRPRSRRLSTRSDGTAPRSATPSDEHVLPKSRLPSSEPKKQKSKFAPLFDYIVRVIRTGVKHTCTCPLLW